MSLTSEEEKAWRRSGERCECKRLRHGHIGRCDAKLIKNMNGKRGEYGSWEIHHIDRHGPNTASNYEVLCTYGHDCHYKTRTFGRP